MSFDDNYRETANEIILLDLDIKALKVKKAALEKTLRPAILDKGPQTVGNYTVECYSNPGRKTLDKKALQESLQIDLEPYMKTGAPFTTLRIKSVEAEDDQA